MRGKREKRNKVREERQASVERKSTGEKGVTKRERRRVKDRDNKGEVLRKDERERGMGRERGRRGIC